MGQWVVPATGFPACMASALTRSGRLALDAGELLDGSPLMGRFSNPAVFGRGDRKIRRGLTGRGLGRYLTRL